VENALRHGLAPLACGGQVLIQATRDNASLLLLVSDDGVGLPGGDGEIKEGVGLSNTRARLRHLYGAAHQFEMQGASDQGLTLRMTIPYRRFVEADEDQDAHRG
jgi:LytS/YehU family sensor histidine kinase